LPGRSDSQEFLRLRYGATTSLQHLPIWVGKESELFAKYGVDLEPIHVRGGALITMMIMSGTAPIFGAGAESVVAGRNFALSRTIEQNEETSDHVVLDWHNR